MAVPIARVHLKMAHAALPPLLPTPPTWKMLSVLPTMPCVAAVLPKPLAKPGRADASERWDARKTKPGDGSPPARKNTTSPPPKPCRADSVERWDAHKTAPAISASSSSGKWSSSRVSSAERWDVHKKCCPPKAKLLDDDGESSSTGSSDIDDTEEEEIVWKPRAMYAGPGFVFSAPESSMLPMPTAFLVPVA